MSGILDFESLNLCQPLLEALDEIGYVTPTPIQEQAIPLLIEGNDMLGCAQTGTGKTAALVARVVSWAVGFDRRRSGRGLRRGRRVIRPSAHAVRELLPQPRRTTTSLFFCNPIKQRCPGSAARRVRGSYE